MYILNYIHLAQNYIFRDQRPVELIKVGQENQNLKDMLNTYMNKQLKLESMVQYINTKYVLMCLLLKVRCNFSIG